MNRLLTKTYDAGAAINAHRFVKFDSDDHVVIQAAAASDLTVGIADLGAAAAGDRVDVQKAGIAKLELGGSVTRGQRLTADSVGRGVTATGDAVFGAIAEVSGASGDIIDVLIAFGQLNTTE